MKFTTRFYLAGLSIVLLYALIGVVPMLFFLFNVSLHSFMLPVAITAWISISWFMQKNTSAFTMQMYLTGQAFVLFVFAASLIFTQNFYDTSFDGNWYHLDAVYNLYAGWNPVYEQLLPEQTSYCETYLNHFPKLSWCYAANVYAFTGNVEAGKSATILLTLACLFIWQFVAQHALKLNSYVSWIGALLVAVNPVQLLNLLSFYTDGQVAAIFSIAIAFFILFATDRTRVYLFLTLSALALLANYKFTSGVYAGLLALSLLIFCIQQHYLPLKKLAFIFFTWLLISYTVIGFSPYVTNTIHKGYPLYPLFEPGDKLFSKKQIYPANFLQMNWPERFINSLFAEPGWTRNPESSSIKKLFHSTNIGSYSIGMPELAGFGPMIPEILVILFPLFLLALVLSPQKLRHAFIILISVISITILINPEAWVLRYVPQFWLIILAMLYLVWVQPKLKYFALILALCLMLNNYMLVREYITTNNQNTRNLNDQFSLIKKDLTHYRIYAGWTKSFKNRLAANDFDTAQLVWIPAEDSSAVPFAGSLGAKFNKIVK